MHNPSRDTTPDSVQSAESFNKLRGFFVLLVVLLSLSGVQYYYNSRPLINLERGEILSRRRAQKAPPCPTVPNEQTADSANMSEGTASQTLNGRTIFVLFWTTVYGTSGVQSGDGLRPFRSCSYSNCYITDNRRCLKVAHALIFHAPTFHEFVPPHRKRNQKWIFLNGESPSSRPLGHLFKSHADAFNLTMTYRRDSDIPAPYGEISPKKPQLSTQVNFAAGKTRLVAWMVSHCRTPSQREKYVKQLQNYIDVDIYGGCGHLKCPRRDDSCWDLIDEYKFYLSFENSLCQDYVTEKVFAYMARPVVPVVLGLANYSAILPPKSYIDVRDFDSPQALAQHLKMLDTDDVLYNEYFAWRQSWQVTHHGYHCSLCELLHRTLGQKNAQSNFRKWWNDVCISPRDYFEGHLQL